MKKNRTTLKDYFKKGAIPTEANFADLIDSMLNQDEDNISKEPNDPLKILATGVDEALINFYRTENNEQKLSWQVKQKPTDKPGLNISDTGAASRFFIENGNGNIGINTITPKAKLQVVGAQDQVALRVGTGDGGADFTLDVTGGQGLVSLVAGAKIKPDGGGYTFLGTRGASRINLHDGAINFHTSDATSGTANADAVGLAMGSAKMVLTNTGSLGIGVTPSANAKLAVNGNVQLPGNYDFITQLGMLRMGTPEGSSTATGKVVGAIGFWGLGVQHGQLSFRAGKGFELVDRSKDWPTLNYEYDAYPYADLKIKGLVTTGSVGIGVAPSFKLHIKGSTSTDAELRLDPSKWSAVGDYGQISFGDANHYIRGEFANGMKFYDANRFVFDGSNVGIGTGTTAPGEKLEVNGNIKFGSTDGWRLDTGSWQGANIRYNGGADDATNSATFGFHGGGNRTLNLRVDGNSYVDGSLGVGTTSLNYKLEVAGDVSVGAKTDSPATGYGSKLYFNGASENTDALWMGRYNDSSNVTFLRINVGDDNSNDQLQIGNHYGGNWNTWLSVNANGDAKVSGKLEVKGDQNIIKVATYTLAIVNGGKDTPGKWSVDYSSYGFSEIHAVFVVLQGYSLWNYNGKTDFALDTGHHVKSTDAIPQHVFARVTSSDKKQASGTCYCSESDAGGEADNTVLFTVVVMGKV